AAWSFSTEELGVGRLIVNPRRCCPFVRSIRIRAPSLHRRYPASAVLRAHPSSAPAAAGPHGFGVALRHRSRLPLLHLESMACVPSPLPRWDWDENRRSGLPPEDSRYLHKAHTTT